MKKLKDYEDDIYKCSRCGLCQYVCPVFKVTQSECAVSRGKFSMLNGVLKGELELSNKLKSYLDNCTGCNACKNFCPSGIDACSIFTAAKNEYYQCQKHSWLNIFLNSYNLFKAGLFTLGLCYRVYRFFKLYKIVSFFEKYILKTGFVGKRIMLFNSFARKHIVPSKKQNIKPKRHNAIYFEGCFNKYINSDTKDAIAKILESSDIELIKKDFECCGVSYLFEGNLTAFKKLMKQNISKFDENYDYILTDCASCHSVLKSYEQYTSNNSAKEFSKKILNITDLLKERKFVSKKCLNIAVHKPCHDSYSLIDIVKNIDGINYIEVEDYDSCCGFSGKFAIKNQDESREISKRKVNNYLNKEIDIIVTTCPACILGLNQGLSETQTENKPVVMNLFVFIALFCL